MILHLKLQYYNLVPTQVSYIQRIFQPFKALLLGPQANIPILFEK